MQYDPKQNHISCNSTRIEVDLGALAHNARTLMRALPDGGRLMAVVKANAYSHGARQVTRKLWSIGVRHFAVATAEEGIALRRGGLRGEILVLGYTDPAWAGKLWRYRLTQTLLDESYATSLDRRGYPVRAHLKIDTGMHRLGVDAGDKEAIARILGGCRHLRICGAFTHLCVADEPTVSCIAFTEGQLDAVRSIEPLLAESERSIVLYAKNSAGLLNYGDMLPDSMARTGIALYGAGDIAATLKHPDLIPVMSVRSSIVLTRRIPAGDSVGYGRAWTAQRETTVAVVPMGYADGIPRDDGERGGEVLIRGVRCPIIGRVCMDQMMVDVTDLPDPKVGERVTWLGEDGGDRITAEEIGRRHGTISYEVLGRLSSRPKRIYLDGKE
jgi:serine/alanine racemase